MRDWVKPFLIQDLRNILDETMEDGSEKEKWIKLKIEHEMNSEESMRVGLVNFVNYDFGPVIGFGWSFTEAFGSVLADLPEEQFKKLISMKSVFFTFTPNPGAEVKQFKINSDIKEGEMLQVVTFPFVASSMPFMAIKGEIIHELVHVITGIGGTVKEEDKIDPIAIEWGFKEEIKAYRNYEKENLGTNPC